MTDDPSNPYAKAAVQHLVWALEEIEKAGNEKAATHARKALGALRRVERRSTERE
jgi:hypothetical protein